VCVSDFGSYGESNRIPLEPAIGHISRQLIFQKELTLEWSLYTAGGGCQVRFDRPGYDVARYHAHACIGAPVSFRKDVIEDDRKLKRSGSEFEGGAGRRVDALTPTTEGPVHRIQLYKESVVQNGLECGTYSDRRPVDRFPHGNHPRIGCERICQRNSSTHSKLKLKVLLGKDWSRERQEHQDADCCRCLTSVCNHGMKTRSDIQIDFCVEPRWCFGKPETSVYTAIPGV